MLPVSHPTMPFGTASCQTVSVDHARRLLDEWTEWANSAPPGNGERRDRAVENLQYCLETNTDWLDLSGFNLTTLPKNLPASLRELDVSDNQLTALPARLLTWLEWLDVSDNQLTTLPENLPASLEWLDVSHNELITLPENLPASLQKLYVSHNGLTFLPEALPASLRELNVNNNRLASLPAVLPASLERLYIGFNRLTVLPEMLPALLHVLYVRNNQLTFLPAILPASLRELNINYNQLTFLPALLPTTLEWLAMSNNQLIVLPERLPASLRDLRVDNNRLTALPETLPTSIQLLDVKNNQLTVLPETLPASLQLLDVKNNQLTSLPEMLPASLESLYARNNQLTVLPQTLPDSLQLLDVTNNQLTVLPERIPASLESLYVRNNQLTFLPEALLASLQQLDIRNNRLTALRVNLMVSRNSLNVNGNPLADSARGLPNDFLGTIAYWTHGENAPQWQKIQSEDGAMVFADFLHKLHRGKNGLSGALYSRVREWLGYLGAEESSELRKQIFLVAEEAVTSCVDRAAFYFNKMYWLMMEDRAIKSGVDAAHLIETIRSGFRLQVLGRIASTHVQRRRREAAGFDEEIEIYLAYEYRLREALALPVYTELQFAALAGLTEQDIEVAQATVLRQEQTDFLRYLVTESTAWRQRLQSWDKGKTAAVEANYLEAITSADFSAAVDRELKENGLPVDDSDARRAVCKKIAEAWLFTARLRLTEDYLTAHKALPCLAPFRDACT